MMADEQGHEFRPAPVALTVIERAAGLNASREGVYGHPLEHWTSTGRMWAALISRRLGLDCPDLPADLVALMFDADKSVRLCESPGHEDSMDDKVGYTRGYERVMERVAG